MPALLLVEAQAAPDDIANDARCESISLSVLASVGLWRISSCANYLL